MFSRREGYEVIPMIQKVVNHFGYKTAEDVKRVEMAIRTPCRATCAAARMYVTGL